MTYVWALKVFIACYVVAIIVGSYVLITADWSRVMREAGEFAESIVRSVQAVGP